MQIRRFEVDFSKTKKMLCIPHFLFYNLEGGYTSMNRYELIIMLTILALGVCIIILILLCG